MSKFLITGMSGHLAPHLARLLIKEGHLVHGILRGSSGREYDLLDVLTHQELEFIVFYYMDLRDFYSIQRLVEEEEYDGVFHLASQSHPSVSFDNPVLTWQSNVMGSVNLITALEKTKTRLVFASSSEVYGNQGIDVEILTEEMQLKPSNPYGASKAAIDLYLQERINNGFIDGVVARPFSHLAPRRGKIFSISCDAYQIAKMILGMQGLTLKIGNLQTERVVIDARDVAKAYYLLMITDSLPYKIFNICGSKERLHKMEYYTDILIEISELNIKKEEYPPYWRQIDIQRQWGSSDRIRELGWKEEINIYITLRDVLNYWVNKLKK